ncbi:MAG: outer membrane beta-barrel protein [Nitrospirae bacterium]|nr:outer membrane beta-barrel protein [Nitrospirota bacterium]
MKFTCVYISSRKPAVSLRFIINLKLIFFVSLSLIFIVAPAYAMQLGNAEITPHVTVRGEYDDNINLSSGTTADDEIKDDIVTHLTPVIQAVLPYKGHKFLLDFTGDYRKGAKEKLSELNMSLIGVADLSFPGGLKINLNDTYSKTKFDRELFEKSDVSYSQANSYQIESTYVFVKRLKIGGMYKHRWEESESEGRAAERYTDTAEGRLSVPITWSSVVYLAYTFNKEGFEVAQDRDFSSDKYLLGVRWEGPYRFSLWAEGGYKEIDYGSPEEKDVSDTVGNVGIGVRFSEITQGRFSFGIDAYGKFVFDTGLNYQHSEDTTIRVSASKTTNTSFSSSYSSKIFKATRYNLEIEKEFLEKFSILLSGGYIIHTYTSDDSDEGQDKIVSGEASISYPIEDWLHVGAHYNYAQRNSDNTESEYTNNRIGMFVQFIF